MREFISNQLIEVVMATIMMLLVLLYVRICNLDVPGDTLWVVWLVLMLTTDAKDYLG